jgi:hypothetical protein
MFPIHLLQMHSVDAKKKHLCSLEFPFQAGCTNVDSDKKAAAGRAHAGAGLKGLRRRAYGIRSVALP